MDAAIIGALLKTTLPKALSVLGGSRDVRSIQCELRYIEATIQDHRKKCGGKDTSHLRAAWIRDLTLFAFDIEDCVDRFLRQEMSPGDGEAGFLRRSARAAKSTVYTRTVFSFKIRKLKTRSEEIHRRLKRYIEEETAQAAVAPGGAASIPTAGAHPRSGAPAAAVGMDEPLGQLLELVLEPGTSPDGKLRVISVVGFHGLGKTLLAHQVFDHGDVRRRFPLRVWVCAAGKGKPEVLKEMLDQVLQNGAGTSTDSAPQADSAPAGTRSGTTTSNANGVVPQVEENGVEQVENGESTSAGVHVVTTWRHCLQAVWWTLATILLYVLSPAFTVANMVRASSIQVDSADLRRATANASISTSTMALVDENKSVQMKMQVDRGKAIQEDTHKDDADDTTLIEQRLGSYLKNKRYLIVIDGMQTEELCNITSVFPVDNGVNSRVIVTTTIKKIARRCSSANGRVYKMKTLDDNDSRKLFFEVFSKGKYSVADATELKASALLEKCGGLPLALESKAKFLKSEEDLTKSKCEDACRKLCAPEGCDDTLGRMHGVLASSYESLCSLVLQQCLLYFCMFPRGHRVRRNPLIRRWLAEGLVHVQPGDAVSTTPQDIAIENLETLIDRSIIQSMEVSTCGNVKRCQPPGMMLEYIVRKSMSQNFITLLCGESETAEEWDYVRRLSLHDYCAAKLPKGLSRLRTLAVFPAGDAAKNEPTLDFAKYDLLRVLDLEECDGLTDGHLQNICSLVFLKYLSLGGLISEVPKKIARLQWLETLDLRRTKIEKVPVEVIQLPQLKHLHGKFQLIEGDCVKANPEHLSKRSTLETLSGFVMGESEGFPQLMSHMKRLRKVKIWCKSTAKRRNLNQLEEAIKVFIRDGNEWPHRSLSIDFQECSDPFLSSLKAPGSLASLKLRGNLSRFPQFITKLNRLEELCLSSTSLSRGVLLSGGRLDTLKYLKLIEDNIGPLEIRHEHFPSLRRICLVGAQSLHDVATGTLPHLTSLHMICESLDGLAGIEIRRLEGLKEVRLHSAVDQGTKDAWKEAARGHPKRPDVLLQ
ncbi:disease resistance protein RGA4-like [Hordeum vulgare subsp. vulgare]|uniref:NB-ARC domain-containing protein n=8 Tax=Hordeum vulgare TaxID=4513 RepID=A0A287VEE0_HORVV|nr:disease resistance protein RGA4-like [Hordeum vulgare subsp. vulgare]AAY34259.1 NBS-LRR resistance-like protein [Hordeum vulgare]